MQRYGVHAVTLASGIRSVVENVTEVRAASCAGDRGAQNRKAMILRQRDVLVRDGFPETGPAGAGLKLGPGGKQGRIAANATI